MVSDRRQNMLSRCKRTKTDLVDVDAPRRTGGHEESPKWMASLESLKASATHRGDSRDERARREIEQGERKRKRARWTEEERAKGGPGSDPCALAPPMHGLISDIDKSNGKTSSHTSSASRPVESAEGERTHAGDCATAQLRTSRMTSLPPHN